MVSVTIRFGTVDFSFLVAVLMRLLLLIASVFDILSNSIRVEFSWYQPFLDSEH